MVATHIFTHAGDRARLIFSRQQGPKLAALSKLLVHVSRRLSIAMVRGAIDRSARVFSQVFQLVRRSCCSRCASDCRMGRTRGHHGAGVRYAGLATAKA